MKPEDVIAVYKELLMRANDEIVANAATLMQLRRDNEALNERVKAMETALVPAPKEKAKK